MITDAELIFSEDQDLSQTAAAYKSTNDYDRGPINAANIGAIGTDVGAAWGLQRLFFFWMCTETFASAGNATIQIQLLSDDTADGYDGSSIVHYDSGALDASTAGTPLAAGDFACIPLPPRSIDGLEDWKRYVGVLYTIGTATTTAGTITAGLVSDPQYIIRYASGLNFFP